MVTTYKPVRKEDLKLDDTKRLITNVEILEGITGLVKKTQLPGELTSLSNLKVALVEGRSGLDIGRVDVSDREVRLLGVVFGSDAEDYVRIPLVDSSRYVHTVVESGKVEAVVTSGSVLADVSGQIVKAEQQGAWPVEISGQIVRAEQYGAWQVGISGELVIADISGGIVDISDRSGRELGTVDISDRSGREVGTVDVRSLDWALALGTFWSGAVVVNPGDNVGVTVDPYTRSTLYIRSHSGTMSFRVSLRDGYEYRTMEEKSFSGDMIWTIEHVTPGINLMSLSSGTVTARLYAAKW